MKVINVKHWGKTSLGAGPYLSFMPSLGATPHCNWQGKEISVGSMEVISTAFAQIFQSATNTTIRLFEVSGRFTCVIYDRTTELSNS